MQYLLVMYIPNVTDVITIVDVDVSTIDSFSNLSSDLEESNYRAHVEEFWANYALAVLLCIAALVTIIFAWRSDKRQEKALHFQGESVKLQKDALDFEQAKTDKATVINMYTFNTFNNQDDSLIMCAKKALFTGGGGR